MQVVSGPEYAPKVHFEAPPSVNVPREMARFIDSFNRSAPGGSDQLPALTRAAMAHFYFVCIHPFEDGNRRVARAIAEKVLAQSLGRPTLMAVAQTILARRKAYYDVLERTNTEIDLTDWLCWCAAAALEAQRRTIALVEFLFDKTRLLDRVTRRLSQRQQKALLRVLREGPEGFKGGLSAADYITITGATTATATRDLADLMAKTGLVRAGERRHARYHVNIPLRPVGGISIDDQGRVVEAG